MIQLFQEKGLACFQVFNPFFYATGPSFIDYFMNYRWQAPQRLLKWNQSNQAVIVLREPEAAWCTMHTAKAQQELKQTHHNINLQMLRTSLQMLNTQLMFAHIFISV